MELPAWTSLIVNRDIIPYDDLSISPGYDRKILLPDDIPPILALPWALGPKVPRANRCQDDGSLNVYVVNQAGGGGAHATSQWRTPNHLGHLAYAALNPVINQDTAGYDRYLYGYSLTSWISTAPRAGTIIEIDLTLRCDIGTGVFDLCPILHTVSDLTVTQPTYAAHVMFPAPLDLTYALGGFDGSIRIRGDSAQDQFTGALDIRLYTGP